MRLRTSLVVLALCGTATGLVAQSPAPSEVLRPALDGMKQALDGVRLEKWKGSAAGRAEVETNMASIRRDVGTTLPPLLAAADAAPDSAAKMLPAYRNVEALNDVLLRVVVAARLGAPAEQSGALDQALTRLEDGRRTMGDRLQQVSEAEERHSGELQASLKAAQVAAAAVPPAPVCPVVPPVKKKAKVAVKPVTPPATN